MSASLLLAGDPRSMWKRYIVALLLIAGLLTTSHFAPHWSIQANAKNAELLNISGRQRMLSQRILLLSAQLAEDYDQSSHFWPSTWQIRLRIRIKPSVNCERLTRGHCYKISIWPSPELRRWPDRISNA